MALALHYAILLSVLFSISFPPSSADDTPTTTAYEILQQYDFPVGLLPTGVASYELDKSTGEFSVHLNNICNIKINTYTLKYESTITGVISNDKLASINGIQVNAFSSWFGINEVTRGGDKLIFSAGISASFPVSSFSSSPSCA